MEQVFDNYKLTDIELAMNLLRLMDAHNDLHEFQKVQNPSNGMDTYIRMAEHAVKTMTNPFAKRLLKSRMPEQNSY